MRLVTPDRTFDPSTFVGVPLRPVSESFVRQLSDRYALQQAIGEGGTATVYLAHDVRHDRPVIVKVLFPELVQGGGPRFLREIGVTAKLRHPNILPLLDSGTADGLLYYVMPYMAEGSLRDRLERVGALPLNEVVQIVRDVAGALDHAHAHGVIHRDIKPENILLEAGRAVVADFGIAHAMDGVGGARLTASGVALGTPAYMSPEQADPSRIDGRSDLYSLGCIVYEMLTEHAPFSGSTPRELLARHAVDPVPPLRSARPGLPSALEQVVATALAKAPADRYQSGQAFVEALEATTRRSIRTAPPRRRPSWVASMLLVGAVTTSAFLFWRSTGHASFKNRDWILVADLAGDVRDSTLRTALRDAFMLTLQQSRYVNVEPASAIAQTLRMMERPDTTRLTDSIAREVAIRQGARGLLLAGIARLDSSFVLTARVVSPQSGDALFTTQERATSRDQVLGALDRLAASVRRQLGERLQDASPAMKLEAATTSSLEALSAWTRGTQLFGNGRYRIAATEFSQAIALDSTFAMAHKALGATLYWLNQRDSGEVHFQRALSLRDRLTDRERLIIEADVAKWREQTSDAVALYQQVLTRYPDDIGARRSLGFTLLSAGRCDEAVEHYDWLRLRDSTDVNAQINLATCKAQLHRVSEAVTHYQTAFALRPEMVRSASNVVQEFGQVLVWAGRSQAAESLFRVQLTGSGDARAQAQRWLAMLALFHGQPTVARQFLREAIIGDSTGSNGPTSQLRDRMFLVRALRDAGQTDSARLQLRAASAFVESHTLDAPWLMDLGDLAAQVGETGIARALEHRLAPRVQRGNANDARKMHILRGDLALIDGDTAAAADHFTAAAALRQTPEALMAAGNAAMLQGNDKEAESRFTELVGMGPYLSESLMSFFQAHLNLGTLAMRRGDTTIARAHFVAITQAWAGGDSTLLLHQQALRQLASLDRPTKR